MKTSPTSRTSRQIAFGVLAAGVTALSTTGYAQVVLQIDVSNTSAVTFTALSTHASGTDGATLTGDGVDLLTFFTGLGYTSGTFRSGNLTANGATGAYSNADADNYSGEFTDLNLYTYLGSEAQNFHPGAAPFTGASTLDLTSAAGTLPTPGTTGNIISGWSGGGNNVVIGQWQVVPETPPIAQFTVYLAAFAGIIVWRQFVSLKRPAPAPETIGH